MQNSVNLKLEIALLAFAIKLVKSFLNYLLQLNQVTINGTSCDNGLIEDGKATYL